MANAELDMELSYYEDGELRIPLTAASFTGKQRERLAAEGDALPDGSFPIRNRSDLRNAIQAIGRAKNPAAAKTHIVKRARALGALADLPDDWKAATAAAVPADDEQGEPAVCADCGDELDENGVCPTCGIDGYGTMTASAVGLATELPPLAWFDVPESSEPTALTITADGQVYGHAATWSVCHTGIQGRCQTAPRSRTNYGTFHLGEVDTVEGKPVAVGKITLDTGHAPLTAGSRATAAHYDDTGTVAAYVRARDGQHGIWVSGALDPDLPAAKVRALKAAALSGDWRAINGNLELVGLLAVNVPGFPVPRAQAALAASGAEDEVEALVAAGVVCGCDDNPEAELADLVADTVGERELNDLVAACVPGKKRRMHTMKAAT